MMSLNSNNMDIIPMEFFICRLGRFTHRAQNIIPSNHSLTLKLTSFRNRHKVHNFAENLSKLYTYFFL